MNGKYIFIFLPTVAVLVGMYILKNAVLTILIYHFGIITILFFAKKIHYFKECFKGWNNLFGIPPIVAMPLFGIILYVLWPFFTVENLDFYGFLNSMAISKKIWIPFALYFSIVNPIMEEAFWRAFYDDALFTVADLGFAVYHLFVIWFIVRWYWLIPMFVALTGVSVFWKFLRRKCGGLLVPLATHIIADICVIGVATIAMTPVM